MSFQVPSNNRNKSSLNIDWGNEGKEQMQNLLKQNQVGFEPDRTFILKNYNHSIVIPEIYSVRVIESTTEAGSKVSSVKLLKDNEIVDGFTVIDGSLEEPSQNILSFIKPKVDNYQNLIQLKHVIKEAVITAEPITAQPTSEVRDMHTTVSGSKANTGMQLGTPE